MELARTEHPKLRFECAEMLEFMMKQQPESLSSVCAFYSVFHLPRIIHPKLFTAIYESLQPSGSLLLTLTPHASECYENDWLGGSRMYFSQFSAETYELLLRDIGFELVAKVIAIFNISFTMPVLIILSLDPATSRSPFPRRK